MNRFVNYLFVSCVVAAGPLLVPETVSAQDSLSFSSYTIESGVDLTAGVVYRFHDVMMGVDALVSLDALHSGATLVQIDDASPSTPTLSPHVRGVASSTPDPSADFTVRFVQADTSTPIALDLLDVASVDIDGGAPRKEFTVLSGFDSYKLEGSPPTLLTVSTVSNGTRFLAPEQDYGGSSPDTTEVAVVASYSGVSHIEFSLGQTGTATTAGNRVSALFFMPDIVPYVAEDETPAPDGVIGSAMQTGTPTDNGNGTFTIPVVVTLVAYGTTSLYDLVVNGDLTALGTFSASTPTEGEYTVDDPIISSTTGGAVVGAGSANAGYDGSSDKSVMSIVTGNVMPTGSTVSISYNIVWYPSTGVDQADIYVVGRADHAEDLASAGASLDLSTSGTDPDPDSDGPGNNFSVTVVDVGSLPVELAAFDAVVDNRSIRLRWQTVSETNFSEFEVQVRPQTTNGKFVAVGSVPSAGNGIGATPYAFTTPPISPGVYDVRLRMIDVDGSFAYSPMVTVTVEIGASFELGDAYPNPSTGRFDIPFALQRSGEIELSVYDLTGRRLALVGSGVVNAGGHRVSVDGTRFPAGVYLYRLQTPEGSITRSITIAR